MDRGLAVLLTAVAGGLIALQAPIIYVLGPIGVSFGLTTIIVGHGTFCGVVVYNNVIARLRRLSGSFEEASADLGADSLLTFRAVTFPALRHPFLRTPHATRFPSAPYAWNTLGACLRAATTLADETKAEAEKAFDLFLETFVDKYPAATACLENITSSRSICWSGAAVTWLTRHID